MGVGIAVAVSGSAVAIFAGVDWSQPNKASDNMNAQLNRGKDTIMMIIIAQYPNRTIIGACVIRPRSPAWLRPAD